MSFTPLLSAPSNPTADRRSAPRRRFERLTYAEFGPDKGGILIDISESGSRFQSVSPVAVGEILPVSFILTGSVATIKAAAKVIWCNDSGKGGGLRFVELPEAARRQIGTWVSSDPLPAAQQGGPPVHGNERDKFNLLTTEGQSSPEPTSDAAALAMARLLVSARGSSKRDAKPHEKISSQNGQSHKSIPGIDPDARPTALSAPEPAAKTPVNYSETAAEPAPASSSPREAIAHESVDREPIAEQAAQPLAAAAEKVAEEIAAGAAQTISDPEPAIQSAVEIGAGTIEPPAKEEASLTVEAHPYPALELPAEAEEVSAVEAQAEAEPASLAAAEIAAEISSAQIFAAPEPLLTSIPDAAVTAALVPDAMPTVADATISQPQSASAEAMPEPPAEATSIEPPVCMPTEELNAVAAQTAGAEPPRAASPTPEPARAFEPVTMTAAKPANAEAVASAHPPAPKSKDFRLKEATAPAPVATNNKNNKKKAKHAHRNPLGIPSILDEPSAAPVKAAPPPVPHWGVQVLRFTVGVGVGCCLVAGAFVGIQLWGPGHRAFSLTHDRPDAVEAAALSVGQPLEVEVVDLNSHRWRLSDNPAGNDVAAAFAPQSPVVELTPAGAATTPIIPLPAPAAISPSAPSSHVKPRPIPKSGSKLMALQRPRVAARTTSNDLRAPSISEGIAPALSSELGGAEAHGPAPATSAAPATPATSSTDSRPVFPSLVNPAPARQSSNFQAPVLLEQVKLVYPEIAKQQHVTGTVRLNAIIGKEGIPHSLRVISGDPRLAPAAIAAVSQWLYKPAQINGEPVDSETTISVEFQLH